MSKHRKLIAGILIALNAVLLLGQLWPEGAPPFARTANIVVLALTLAFLASLVLARADERS